MSMEATKVCAGMNVLAGFPIHGEPDANGRTHIIGTALTPGRILQRHSGVADDKNGWIVPPVSRPCVANGYVLVGFATGLVVNAPVAELQPIGVGK